MDLNATRAALRLGQEVMTMYLYPNEALRMARTATEAIKSAGEDVQFGNVERLAEAFAALDEWLSFGVRPSDWDK